MGWTELQMQCLSASPSKCNVIFNFVNNLFAVQNLKMALKKANILHTKAFWSDTPQSIKLQNKGLKEHERKSRHCVDRRSSFSLLDSGGNFS